MILLLINIWSFFFYIWLYLIGYCLYVFKLFLVVSIPLSVFVISVLILFKVLNNLSKIPTDESLTPTELIESRGFTAEEHVLTTSDGYTLVLHRIVNPYIDKTDLQRKPVLLEHGLGANGVAWIVNDDNDWDLKGVLEKDQSAGRSLRVENSLGFDLAKRGYDVWLGNQRGNVFSVGHKTLDPKTDPKFWDFSMDEMIQYDLPETIEYILKETKQTTLSYIGISQGTSIMFGLLSSQPKYNEIVNPFIAVAPVVRISRIPVVGSLPRYLQYPVLRLFVCFLERRPGLLWPSFCEQFSHSFLANHSLEIVTNQLGKYVLQYYGGKQVNEKRMNVFGAHPGIHCSRKNMAHIVQMHFRGSLRKYDYGKAKNMRLYNQNSPPAYDLGKISNKNIALIYSRYDTLLSIKDVKYLKSQLTVPLLDDYVVKKTKWDHYDFQLGKDCGKHVNAKIVHILNKCNK